jgi:peptide/nickel transport system substrate-binding protein
MATDKKFSRGIFRMTKWKSKLSLLMVFSLIAALLLAGCSDTTSKNQNSKPGDTSKTPAAVSKPLVLVPQPGGSFQKNFNPFSASANGGTNGLLYQPLYYFSNVGPDEYPLLATKYEWTNGNKTLLVTVRDNVKWSDGKPFSADDVIFTFNLLKQYSAADSAGIWKEVTSIEKQGTNQVAFNFSTQDVPFQVYVLSTVIVPEHIWKSVGDPTKATVDPVGTGPYLLDTFNPQVYKMKLNPNYYGEAPAVKELQFPAFNGNDSANLALAKGEIDWAGIFIPKVEDVFAAKSPHNKFWFPPSNIVTLYTNLKNSILNQLPVRKAISLAIDREKLSTQAEYGYEPVASPTGLTLPNNQQWVDPSLPAESLKFAYDKDKAVKTLEDAGFKKGKDGIFVSPEGKPLKFNLQVVSGWTDWVTITQLISQQLKDIGIEVKVEQVQFGAYMDNIQNQKYDMAISWTNAGPNPYYQYQDLLSSHGKWNLEKWNDTETDAALKAFQSTTDPNEQKQAIYKIQKIMIDKLPSIPLLYGAIWYEYNDSKYTGWPDKDHPYANPAPFTWPAVAIVLSKLKPVQ